jgi:hypothetical protein
MKDEYRSRVTEYKQVSQNNGTWLRNHESNHNMQMPCLNTFTAVKMSLNDSEMETSFEVSADSLNETR